MAGFSNPRPESHFGGRWQLSSFGSLPHLIQRVPMWFYAATSFRVKAVGPDSPYSGLSQLWSMSIPLHSYINRVTKKCQRAG